MTVDVLLERHWDTPLTEEGLSMLAALGSDCLALHRCEWQSSLLSNDGHDLFCQFRCPDAESLRIAMRQAGSPRGWVWVSTIHDAPGCSDAALAEANVLVSRSFEAPVRYEDLAARAKAGHHCLEMHRVQFLRSYFSADGRRALCLYQAPDAESVRIAQRQATMPVERVLGVRRFA